MVLSFHMGSSKIWNQKYCGFKWVYPNFSNVLVSKITTFITTIAKVQFPPGGLGG